ncbi:hypothetical protein [Pseudomonas sp. UMAB-08]|uniref:WD40/YVTN/BNR-like repeat-containing protein n=1 Tax=Pseudomonas sp. UMAB-08 TaxID=1365375 RepID=UPI001C59374C|nr:hypothetical protein [Pseudomonas sp. UMAB-08]
MAVSTTPPLLTPLPPAPLPTDAEAVFDAKAGASLTAQAAMVAEVNASLTWQAGATADTKGYKDAAATSAGTAADSATLAGQKVGLAADQVVLAVTARQAAQAALASTVVVAAAAQSAAGLPSLVGHGGQALCVKLDETGVEFKSLSQAIGDVLETTRTPDATYLLQDTIYSRAAYPDLFAIVGTIGVNRDISNVAVSTSPNGTGALYCAQAGLNEVILLGGKKPGAADNAAGSIVYRSADGGTTWASVPSLADIVGPIVALQTDGNGVWLAAGYWGALYRSTDNGMTFAPVPGSPWSSFWYSTPIVSITTNGLGKWVVAGYGNQGSGSPSAGILTSTDNGANFTNSTRTGFYTFAGVNLSGVVYTNATAGAATASGIEVSTNGTTWASLGAGDGLDNISGLMLAGNRLIYIKAGALYTIESYSKSWSMILGGVQQAYIAADGTIYAYTASTGTLSRSLDNGIAWEQEVISMAPYFSTSPMKTSAGTYLSILAKGVAGIVKATRQYNYDVATQFKTPAHKTSKGYKAYIKGKLA